MPPNIQSQFSYSHWKPNKQEQLQFTNGMKWIKSHQMVTFGSDVYLLSGEYKKDELLEAARWVFIWLVFTWISCWPEHMSNKSSTPCHSQLFVESVTVLNPVKWHCNCGIWFLSLSPRVRHFEGETLNDKSFPCYYRSGNEEKLMALLTPLNVNCHASDGRKVKEPLIPHHITPGW